MEVLLLVVVIFFSATNKAFCKDDYEDSRRYLQFHSNYPDNKGNLIYTRQRAIAPQYQIKRYEVKSIPSSYYNLARINSTQDGEEHSSNHGRSSSQLSFYADDGKPKVFQTGDAQILKTIHSSVNPRKIKRRFKVTITKKKSHRSKPAIEHRVSKQIVRSDVESEQEVLPNGEIKKQIVNPDGVMQAQGQSIQQNYEYKPEHYYESLNNVHNPSSWKSEESVSSESSTDVVDLTKTKGWSEEDIQNAIQDKHLEVETEHHSLLKEPTLSDNHYAESAKEISFSPSYVMTMPKRDYVFQQISNEGNPESAHFEKSDDQKLGISAENSKSDVFVPFPIDPVLPQFYDSVTGISSDMQSTESIDKTSGAIELNNDKSSEVYRPFYVTPTLKPSLPENVNSEGSDGGFYSSLDTEKSLQMNSMENSDQILNTLGVNNDKILEVQRPSYYVIPPNKPVSLEYNYHNSESSEKGVYSPSDENKPVQVNSIDSVHPILSTSGVNNDKESEVQYVVQPKEPLLPEHDSQYPGNSKEGAFNSSYEVTYGEAINSKTPIHILHSLEQDSDNKNEIAFHPPSVELRPVLAEYGNQYSETSEEGVYGLSGDGTSPKVNNGENIDQSLGISEVSFLHTSPLPDNLQYLKGSKDEVIILPSLPVLHDSSKTVPNDIDSNYKKKLFGEVSSEEKPVGPETEIDFYEGNSDSNVITTPSINSYIWTTSLPNPDFVVNDSKEKCLDTYNLSTEPAGICKNINSKEGLLEVLEAYLGLNSASNEQFDLGKLRLLVKKLYYILGMIKQLHLVQLPPKTHFYEVIEYLRWVISQFESYLLHLSTSNVDRSGSESSEATIDPFEEPSNTVQIIPSISRFIRGSIEVIQHWLSNTNLKDVMEVLKSIINSIIFPNNVLRHDSGDKGLSEAIVDSTEEPSNPPNIVTRIFAKIRRWFVNLGLKYIVKVLPALIDFLSVPAKDSIVIENTEPGYTSGELESAKYTLPITPARYEEASPEAFDNPNSIEQDFTENTPKVLVQFPHLYEPAEEQLVESYDKPNSVEQELPEVFNYNSYWHEPLELQASKMYEEPDSVKLKSSKHPYLHESVDSSSRVRDFYSKPESADLNYPSYTPQRTIQSRFHNIPKEIGWDRKKFQWISGLKSKPKAGEEQLENPQWHERFGSLESKPKTGVQDKLENPYWHERFSSLESKPNTGVIDKLENPYWHERFGSLESKPKIGVLDKLENPYWHEWFGSLESKPKTGVLDKLENPYWRERFGSLTSLESKPKIGVLDKLENPYWHEWFGSLESKPKTGVLDKLENPYWRERFGSLTSLESKPKIGVLDKLENPYWYEWFGSLESKPKTGVLDKLENPYWRERFVSLTSLESKPKIGVLDKLENPYWHEWFGSLESKPKTGVLDKLENPYWRERFGSLTSLESKPKIGVLDKLVNPYWHEWFGSLESKPKTGVLDKFKKPYWHEWFGSLESKPKTGVLDKLENPYWHERFGSLESKPKIGVLDKLVNPYWHERFGSLESKPKTGVLDKLENPYWNEWFGSLESKPKTGVLDKLENPYWHEFALGLAQIYDQSRTQLPSFEVLSPVIERLLTVNSSDLKIALKLLLKPFKKIILYLRENHISRETIENIIRKMVKTVTDKFGEYAAKCTAKNLYAKFVSKLESVINQYLTQTDLNNSLETSLPLVLRSLKVKAK